jgi:Domain of unknown function (DUF4126)
VHLVFDIFQGIGVATAVGIRPFLPSLAVGAMAAGDVELKFSHTPYSFLQSPVFLLALVLAEAVLLVLEWRAGGLGPRAVAFVVGVVSIALGALLFAGTLCHGGHRGWPGLIGGVVCAGVGIAGSWPFVARLRGRLDAGAASVGPTLIAEGAGVLIAVLSVVAPPVGPVALAAMLWLAISGRGRDGQKYAGLRILR